MTMSPTASAASSASPQLSSSPKIGRSTRNISARFPTNKSASGKISRHSSPPTNTRTKRRISHKEAQDSQDQFLDLKLRRTEVDQHAVSQATSPQISEYLRSVFRYKRRTRLQFDNELLFD